MCFPVNFAKFPKKAFSENTSERLLLFIINIELIPLLPQQKKIDFLLFVNLQTFFLQGNYWFEIIYNLPKKIHYFSYRSTRAVT